MVKHGDVMIASTNVLCCVKYFIRDVYLSSDGLIKLSCMATGWVYRCDTEQKVSGTGFKTSVKHLKMSFSKRGRCRMFSFREITRDGAITL